MQVAHSADAATTTMTTTPPVILTAPPPAVVTTVATPPPPQPPVPAPEFVQGASGVASAAEPEAAPEPQGATTATEPEFVQGPSGTGHQPTQSTANTEPPHPDIPVGAMGMPRDEYEEIRDRYGPGAVHSSAIVNYDNLSEEEYEELAAQDGKKARE